MARSQELKNRAVSGNFDRRSNQSSGDHHEIPSDIANNQNIAQQNQKKYLGPTIVFNNLAILLLCLAFEFETWSKYSYTRNNVLPQIAAQTHLLDSKVVLGAFFLFVFFIVDMMMSFIMCNEIQEDNDSPLFPPAYQIFSSIFIIVIFLLGLASDAMPFGDEGTPLLTWNKFWQTPNNDRFSYRLTYHFDRNCTRYAYWNGVSDFYDIVVDLNRVLNYADIDQFLTSHDCRLDDLASFLRSISSGYSSSIYC